ncbi:hypothetical protein ACIQGZ_13840 [Streptomyces sp. NPDC092296]|uniref:hypothetical protein n=1 Tax=Streptomyces sp. NPDC092296 TaxID=3366012 RepID=UPI003800A00C
MAKIGSGVVVTGLTLGALAVITALAVQANGTEDRATAAPAPSTSPVQAAPTATAPAKPKVPAVPAHSGSGRRVVYSLGQDRVWLVDPTHKPQVVRTFTVQPSTVDPDPGTYPVHSFTPTATGSDGTPIEHVVLFAYSSDLWVGFSAAVDGSTPKPDPAKKTGGVRETRADGKALWDFTHVTQSKIIVVD